MTAKEKAIKLYSAYYNRIEHTLSEEYSTHEKDIVKECALIAVDEIINALDESLINADIEFFKQVKKEIEKL